MRTFSSSTIGEVEEFRQSSPPKNPTLNAIWIQTAGSPNAVWIWNGNYWLSASGLSVIRHVPFSGNDALQILPIQQSINYGTYLVDSFFTGRPSVNNDSTNYLSFQLICGGVSYGLSLLTQGMAANIDSLKTRSLGIGIIPSQGSLLSLSMTTTGNPGIITGILTLNYRFIFLVDYISPLTNFEAKFNKNNSLMLGVF